MNILNEFYFSADDRGTGCQASCPRRWWGGTGEFSLHASFSLSCCLVFLMKYCKHKRFYAESYNEHC